MTTNNLIRAFKATMGRDSCPNYEKSFRTWQKESAVTRKALAGVEEIYISEKKRITDTYAPVKAEAMLNELKQNYEEARIIAESELREKLNAVVESKKEALRKASKAPSTEDINLLSALKMRSYLTEDEVIRAAESMSNNLVSLGTLADIASDAGIHLAIPTAASLEDELNKAVDFAEDMLKDLTTPDEKLTYNGTMFYNYPDSDKGIAAVMFSNIDNNVFTSEQIRERISKGTLDLKGYTNSKATASIVELRDGNSIQNLALQFGCRYADIEKANPGVNLEELHPGDNVIIPSGKMKILNGISFVTPEQVSPYAMPTASCS